jgi:hypothetical protein
MAPQYPVVVVHLRSQQANGTVRQEAMQAAHGTNAAARCHGCLPPAAPVGAAAAALAPALGQDSSSATHSLGLLLGFQVLNVQCAKASVLLPSKCDVKVATGMSWVLTHLLPVWVRPIHQEAPAADKYGHHVPPLFSHSHMNSSYSACVSKAARVPPYVVEQ